MNLLKQREISLWEVTGDTGRNSFDFISWFCYLYSRRTWSACLFFFSLDRRRCEDGFGLAQSDLYGVVVQFG